jgi:hypothetical protein
MTHQNTASGPLQSVSSTPPSPYNKELQHLPEVPKRHLNDVERDGQVLTSGFKETHVENAFEQASSCW